MSDKRGGNHCVVSVRLLIDNNEKGSSQIVYFTR